MGVKDKFKELGDKALQTATDLTIKAQPHVEKAKEKAQPHVDRAREKAQPHIDKAKAKMTEFSANVQEGAEAAKQAAQEDSDITSEEE